MASAFILRCIHCNANNIVCDDSNPANYISVSSAWSNPEAIHVASGGLGELPSGPLSTKTVLGFLDFVTTVSDTVIKFTSQGGDNEITARSMINNFLISTRQVLETHPLSTYNHPPFLDQILIRTIKSRIHPLLR